MFIPGLVWVAICGAEWIAFNWVISQALANGNVVYDVFATIAVGTVWWLVDQYGNKYDEMTTVNYYYDQWQYGYTVEPNGSILYH